MGAFEEEYGGYMSRGSTYLVSVVVIAFVGILLISAKWQDEAWHHSGSRLERIALLAEKAREVILHPKYPPNAADQLGDTYSVIEEISKISRER